MRSEIYLSFPEKDRRIAIHNDVLLFFPSIAFCEFGPVVPLVTYTVINRRYWVLPLTFTKHRHWRLLPLAGRKQNVWIEDRKKSWSLANLAQNNFSIVNTHAHTHT